MHATPEKVQQCYNPRRYWAECVFLKCYTSATGPGKWNKYETMVDGRAEDRVRDEVKRGKARGLGVRGGVTRVTRAVNIGRNEGPTRNKGCNSP